MNGTTLLPLDICKYQLALLSVDLLNRVKRAVFCFEYSLLGLLNLQDFPLRCKRKTYKIIQKQEQKKEMKVHENSVSNGHGLLCDIFPTRFDCLAKLGSLVC